MPEIMPRFPTLYAALCALYTYAIPAHAEATWDAAVDFGGGGFATTDGAKFFGMARVRPGVLLPHGDQFWAFGPYFEVGSRSWGTVGAQAEYLDLKSALWSQVMVFHDLEVGRPGAGIAGGWSVFGVELQQRSLSPEGNGFVALVKVHLPLGVAGYAMREGKHK